MDSKEFFLEKIFFLNKNKRLFSDAVFDWKIMLSIFILTNIIISSFAIYSYVNFYKGDAYNLYYDTTQNASSMKINKELLMNVVLVFNKKAENFEKVKNERPKIIDPSI